MTFTGGRTFEYVAETQHIVMHGGMYFLTFDPATGKVQKYNGNTDPILGVCINPRLTNLF